MALARGNLRLVSDEGTTIPSDGELVTRVLAGELDLREQLYRRHVDYVSGIAARILRSMDQAEDAVQEIFVHAFRKLALLRNRDAFRPWIAAITVRIVQRKLRRQRWLRLVGVVGESDASLDLLASPGASPETLADLAALDVVLQRLPADQRIAWVLRHVEGEKLEDVAAACDVSLSTAKRWITAAEETVRAELGEVFHG